jgi:dienelactone hydrolase
MTRRTAPWLSALFALSAAPCPAAEPAAEAGTVRFDPSGDETAGVPEPYRLAARTFEYRLSLRFELRHTGVDVYDLTFPSPVRSGVPENDTVHAEYFVPKGPGRFPAVLVLDILDGQQVVSRGEALWLARSGVAALVVYMAHYGPRRPPGSRARLLSTDVPHTLQAIRQTVLDCRCAAAWLAARPEVDPERLGLVGTSLGSLVGALVAAAEPRLKNVCLLLTGGGLVDAFYDHPRARPYTQVLDLLGGKEAVKRVVAPADPITYAGQLRGKNLLLIAASRDDVIPPAAAKALWEATGKQKILWVDATHVGAAVYAFPVMRAVIAHVKGQPGEPRP